MVSIFRHVYGRLKGNICITCRASCAGSNAASRSTFPFTSGTTINHDAIDSRRQTPVNLHCGEIGNVKQFITEAWTSSFSVRLSLNVKKLGMSLDQACRHCPMFAVYTKIYHFISPVTQKYRR